MKNIKLITGNIIFENDSKAIVPKDHNIIMCDTENEACELGEQMLDECEAYLVPSVYKGEIIFE